MPEKTETIACGANRGPGFQPCHLPTGHDGGHRSEPAWNGGPAANRRNTEGLAAATWAEERQHWANVVYLLWDESDEYPILHGVFSSRFNADEFRYDDPYLSKATEIRIREWTIDTGMEGS